MKKSYLFIVAAILYVSCGNDRQKEAEPPVSTPHSDSAHASPPASHDTASYERMPGLRFDSGGIKQ